MATINGTSGDDTLNGTSTADKIYGFEGDDFLNGDGGNDLLDGGLGADTMTGGLGNDIYYVDDLGDSVVEADGEGTDEVRTTLAAYTLGAYVEDLRFTGTGSFTGTGNALNNYIYGGASADTLSGGDGHDYLSGGGGDDSLTGGAGHDTLTGGTGADTMAGNDGDDVYVVDNSGDTVSELAGEGIDHVYTTVSVYTLGDDVENLSWNSYGGTFTGTGNALDNVIYGGSGNDVLSGAGGNDTIRANSGNDTLSGGDGDDLLVGASGADSYTGGAGADTFRIGYYESGTGTAADSIADFASGTDVIDIAGWDADINVSGDQAFTFVGSAAFTSTAGELRTYFDGTDTWVQGDIGGDGIADFEILLSGSVSLVSTDFLL